MPLHPYTSKQLADERRRDMLAHAQHQGLIRQFSSEPGNAQYVQRLTQRLTRRLRAIARPRPVAQA
jgi:hypothetical protein